MCFRFLAVWLPIKTKIWVTPKNANVAIIIIYLTLAIYLGYMVSWSDQLIGGVCVPNARIPGNEKFTGAFLVAGLSLYAFLPSVILIALNCMIILKMLKKNKKLSRSSGKQLSKRLTRMMTWLSISFVILVTPMSLGHLYGFAAKASIYESTDVSVLVYVEVASLMELLNYSINFVYYAWHDRKFVAKVKSLLFHRGGGGSVAPTSWMQNTQAAANTDAHHIKALFTAKGNISNIHI